MEAQRFPTDYDGIVAGAPANYFTHLLAGSLWPAAATLKDDATRLSPAKLSALNKGALAACDAGDGVTDSLISNPLACKFDPSALLCTGAETDACLTAPQVDAAKKIYAYSTNPRTKEKIFAGSAPGSEITWTAMAGGPNPFAIPVEFYKYFVYENPDWDWKTFDFDKDVKHADEKFAKLLNAVDPDLDPFKKRGGKLIMYHGWNDQLIQPYNSIDYFTSVQKKLGTRDTDDFARLFMAPGMQHCAGLSVFSTHCSSAVTASSSGWRKRSNRRSLSPHTRRTASSTERVPFVRIRRWRASRAAAVSTRRRTSYVSEQQDSPSSA